jgi:hypothetical protein
MLKRELVVVRRGNERVHERAEVGVGKKKFGQVYTMEYSRFLRSINVSLCHLRLWLMTSPKVRSHAAVLSGAGYAITAIASTSYRRICCRNRI